MIQSTDRVIELKGEIREIERQIADASDNAQIGRLRGILRATRDELRRLRQRTRAA